ncbi:MAG: hypothetical protein GX117_07750 [Candidatus Hydrogenedentes bacterium]|jgi:hypothetical protein|nr:hypothetical protein [Candidatus Hydrogenedentota bacterium]
MLQRFVLYGILLLGISTAFADLLVGETDYLRWTVDEAGHTASFMDKSTGRNLISEEAKVPLCRLKKAEEALSLTAIQQKDETLILSFGDNEIEVVLHVELLPRYIILSVLSISDDAVDELEFLNVPLNIKGTVEEAFHVCALALNLQTKVVDIPGPSKHLLATAFKRFGIPGASVAITAAPAEALRGILQEVVAAAEDLPKHLDASVPPIGGPWALDRPGNRGSYLFDFGSLTEETVDEWIELVQQLGFNQIDFHTGSSLRFGDCVPNPKLFPKGRASVKAVIDKLHDAGIAAGLHTYAFFIAKDSVYVSPKPDPRLGKDAVFSLTDAVDAEAVTIPVAESTADVSLKTGFFARNSVTLQIDDELIVFSGVTSEAPFAFTECKRGVHGTQAASHAAGAPVYKLKECFGLFTPDGDSSLLAEVAANTADTFNECGFDMMYMDALDGEDILAGGEYGWHYGAKFVYEIANRINRPALFEMSTFHHHLWCVRARMGAWDHPTRAHKRFIDRHCDANIEGARMYLPMNLGWWAVKNWQDGTASAWSEPTYTDDIEYLLCKALGNDMCLSLMGVNPQNIGDMPMYQRLMPLFKRYEDLRHEGTVSESIKKELRSPGKEFVLEINEDETPRFRPAFYDKHRVDSLEAWNATWTMDNPFDRQEAWLRIEALMGVAPYDSEEAVVVEDFSDPDAFTVRKAIDGVQASLERTEDVVQIGDYSGRFTAASKRDAALGSWAQIGRTASPPLNLANKPALGVWVHGDCSGALINLQVLSAAYTGDGGTGDHYITLDFSGWRYFSLVEFESERISDLAWPYGNIYSIYREGVDFKAVESFSLWCNNLPPQEEMACALSPVKALPLVDLPLRNPVLTINGVELRFHVEILCGTSLELHDANTWILYGKKGEELARGTAEGEVPILEEGANQIRFAWDINGDVEARARVTLRSLGGTLAAD